MRIVRPVILLIMTIGLCLPAVAESRKIETGNGFTKTFAFYYETHLDPAVPDIVTKNVGGGVAVMDSVIHRFMLDRNRRMYFGYDISVEVQPQPNTYRVTFNQLTMPPDMLERILQGSPAGWAPLPTPGWGVQPSTRTVRGGEVISLGLLTNNATAQRIVDYITIQDPLAPVTFANVNTPRREFAFATGPARDFRVNDAELRLQGPRLSINGNFDQSTSALNSEVSGRIVWFYAANRGRFLLSLTPQPALGFRKAGEIRGTTLNFTIGTDTFNLVTGASIAPGDGAFNLYVRHEPGWKPTYPFADTSKFVTGAADSADLLIRK